MAYMASKLCFLKGDQMKKVFLKYNPYKLETEITVDGKQLADNSKLGELIVDARLQDWVEDFPGILMEEYNDRDFEIVFHGTLLDYEDLTGVFTDAYHKGLLTATLDRIPAKETADKEGLIKQIFEEITSASCPFQQLRDSQIKAAFDMAMGDDFEVCVVATMSAGKSTLINAMLGKKLMPSTYGACLTSITNIKDEEYGDFCAEVYDKNGNLLEEHEHLNYTTMERLNGDSNVSEIHVFGKIPFVCADQTTKEKEISLILIDTPGPNNSRNPEHGKKQREMLGKSSKGLVLYVMTGEFGTNDDNMLLARVAESMAMRGKQSKDRFIFVVNKLDDRKKEDGSIEQTLEKVRSYLKSYGISNPNLFPAAALPALNIRLMNDPSFDMDEDDRDEAELKIKKLNRNEELHFETWGALPPSIRVEVNNRLEATRATWKGRKNENPEEALIHSGVVSVEAAIRQYVQKYAKTAKIKNIVDTFIHRVKELGCEEQTVLAIAASEKERQRIAEQIQKIQAKLNSGEEAKRFKDAVDDAVIKITDESTEVIESVIQRYQDRMVRYIDSQNFRGDIEVENAHRLVEQLSNFARMLEPNFKKDLTEIITTHLLDVRIRLFEEYKKKSKVLRDELALDNTDDFYLAPLELMSGNIPLDFSVEALARKKEIPYGENTCYSLFQKTKYKIVRYVKADELAQVYLAPLQSALYYNGQIAKEYAVQIAKKMAVYFNKEFEHLDLGNILNSELESLIIDAYKAEQRVEQAKSNKAWLDNIQNRLESILEI